MQPINHLGTLKKEKRDNRKIIVWDIEAAPVWDIDVAPITKEQRKMGDYEPLNTRFIGAGVYDGTTYLFASSIKKLCEILFSDYCENSIIYAHNSSRYDCAFILPYVIRSGIKAQMTYVGNRLWIFLDDRTIADSMAILPGSLEKIAEKLGCQFRKQKIDYRHIEQCDWKPYLKNDCYLLYEAVTTFRSMMKELGGQVKLTLASTAMHLFRRHYLDRVLLTNRAAHDIERQALYGGRTELYKKLATDVHYYDINSSYSTSALENMPCGYIGKFNVGELDDTDIVLARVEVDAPHIPSLPYKGERLLFPQGHWTGYYVGYELKHAQVQYKILKQWKYNSGNFLAAYSKDLFAQKKAGNPAAKLLLNSLYGRFALAEDREQIIFRPTPEEFIERTLEPINEHESIYKYKESIPTFTFPAIFANITAHARIRLLQGMRRAGKDLCYVDTDSIISTKPLNLDIGNGLGQWGLEGKYKEFQGIAPKTYRLDNILKAKGFRLPAEMDAKEFLENRKMGQYRMTSIKQQLKTGEKQGLTGHKRTVRISDEKRHWIGNDSYPLFIGE
jgi:hypothetical protein